MNRFLRVAASKSRAFSSGTIFNPDYAFEMASSTVRFGRGVTKEVGQDLVAMGLTKNVCVVTDPYMATLPPMKAVLDSLAKANVAFEIFDRVAVEPTDTSMQLAIEHCRAKKYDAFIAVGGGSVMDTAKAANAYMCNPKSDFLDFVNAPVGKGLPIPGPLKPLIAIPTTAGTGSETTGVAIFDHTPTGAKTGIRDRTLRPILGIIDPDHINTCGPELAAYNGLDVLCHALESYTAVPYNQRHTGAPARPQLRPAYQGSNSISDIWSGFALQQCSKYLLRAVEGDPVAREQMCLASTSAGVGFGSAGVHLCHAMSYPISSCVSGYRPSSGYSQVLADGEGKYVNGIKLKQNMVPHGLSVVLTAPAVFKWTAQADGARHLRAAELLGADISRVRAADAGLLIADKLVELLSNWSAFMPNGLSGVGYNSSDLDRLVKGTLPQKKVIDVSPRQPTPDDFHRIFESSMKLF